MEKKTVKIDEDDILLRIYISEEDKLHGIPLYEAIVAKAREAGLAGATVVRGILGFGADRRMLSAKIVDLSNNLPIIIEIVDIERNIEGLIPFLDEHVKEGFMTLEKVHVIKYRTGGTDAGH